MTPAARATVTPQTWWLNKPAPDFTVQGLDGKDYTLSVKTRNAPIVLVFWKTTDLANEQEMDDLNDLYMAHRDQGLRVLVLNVGEPRAIVDPYFRIHEHPFTVLLDPESLNNGAYHVSKFPTYFFIGSDGRIKDVFEGTIKQVELEAKTAKVLP